MNIKFQQAIVQAIKEADNDEGSYVFIVTRGKNRKRFPPGLKSPDDFLYTQVLDSDGEWVASVPLDYAALTMLDRFKKRDAKGEN
jgi:hypothetical protein